MFEDWDICTGEVIDEVDKWWMKVENGTPIIERGFGERDERKKVFRRSKRRIRGVNLKRM